MLAEADFVVPRQDTCQKAIWSRAIGRQNVSIAPQAA
jgi:hypothetical protein